MELKIEKIEYSIKLDQPLAGLTTAPMQGPGYLWIMTRGLLTPDNDGRFFYTAMDSFSSLFLSPYLTSGQHFASQIDSAIAIIGDDQNTQVCINAPFLIRARPKRSVSAGEPVSADEIADITDMKLHGINVHNTAGIMLFFHVNWRHALYVDLEPIQPNGSPRAVPFEKELGKIWARLTYPDVFDLTDVEFAKLSDIGWFPFISVRQSAFSKLAHCMKNGFDPKSAIDNWRIQLPSVTRGWKISGERV